MPKLSLEEVEHIAELARLGLSDTEKEMFRDQLSAVLEYVDRLNQLDTTEVPPTTSVLPLPAPGAPRLRARMAQPGRAGPPETGQAQVSNVMRPDVVTPSLPTEDALTNAPDTDADQFRVRAVLE